MANFTEMTPTDSEAAQKVEGSCTVDTLSLSIAGETVKVDTKYGPIRVTVSPLSDRVITFVCTRCITLDNDGKVARKTTWKIRVTGPRHVT
eukprot:179208-Prorocentrum_minimum.AAC.2